jgi:hypothetical protein
MNLTGVDTTRLAKGPRTDSGGPLLVIDDAAFHADFGSRPFRIGHNLCEHPLFKLPRLIELAGALPEEKVEYNAGDIPVNLAPEKTPRTGLPIAETIRRIEECRSWMVLKNVELDDAYRRVLDACLDEVLARKARVSEGVGHREAFIFISSPGAVTPYHMDPELNFLLQVHGTKEMHIFPGGDRSLLSEEELERFYSGAHRNLVFRDEYEQKATTFALAPGDGVHVPITYPHWVKVGKDSYSISFSITFQTRAAERRAALYSINHVLRQKGSPPTPVGQSPWRDAYLYTKFRLGRRLRGLLPRHQESTEASA